MQKFHLPIAWSNSKTWKRCINRFAWNQKSIWLSLVMNSLTLSNLVQDQQLGYVATKNCQRQSRIQSYLSTINIKNNLHISDNSASIVHSSPLDNFSHSSSCKTVSICCKINKDLDLVHVIVTLWDQVDQDSKTTNLKINILRHKWPKSVVHVTLKDQVDQDSKTPTWRLMLQVMNVKNNQNKVKIIKKSCYQ